MIETTATTILRQLGGALVMMGAGVPVAFEHGLQFKIGKGAKEGINKLVITLDGTDTYTIEALKIYRGCTFKTIATVRGIHVDQLHSTIEELTGFRTRL